MATTRLRNRNSSTVVCACQPIDQHHCPTGECVTTSSCFASVRSERGAQPVRQLGCYSNRTDGHHELDRMQCKSRATLRRTEAGVERVLCCGHADFCNRHLNASALATQPAVRRLGALEQLALLALVGSLLLVALLTLAALAARRRRRRKSPVSLPHSSSVWSQVGKGPVYSCPTDSSQLFTSTTHSPAQIDMSSGSGRGLPFVFGSSVARQVRLLYKVGQGRYGSVWCGSYMAGRVAVKIFSSRDEPSFRRECEMYTSFPLGHRNILTFRASDLASCDACTQFWLVCDFHQQGSLHDFLQRQSLNVALALRLALGAVTGLCYLHTEVKGLHSKPAIAHMDVKSRNILVKDDLTCCIADLGFAVVASPQANQPPQLPPHSQRVGTKRYMPPELLAGAFNWQDFESYKAADMYSLSLVLWEIGSRVLCDGRAMPYQLPYAEFVGADPDIDEMRRVVCEAELRPTLPSTWNDQDCSVMLKYQRLLDESWRKHPPARLQALRAQLTISDLLADVGVRESDTQSLLPYATCDQ